jgi:hypothetical protein
MNLIVCGMSGPFAGKQEDAAGRQKKGHKKS